MPGMSQAVIPQALSHSQQRGGQTEAARPAPACSPASRKQEGPLHPAPHGRSCVTAAAELSSGHGAPSGAARNAAQGCAGTPWYAV